MYLMLIGKAPFETAAVEKTYQRISKGQFDFPEWFKDNDAKDLIKNILIVDPVKRYTFDQIVNHPFMCPKCGIPK
jgi:serine/threonine protein kinase